MRPPYGTQQPAVTAPTVCSHCVSLSPSYGCLHIKRPGSVRSVFLPRGSVRAWLKLLVGLTTLNEVGAVAEGHSEGRSPACLP